MSKRLNSAAILSGVVLKLLQSKETVRERHLYPSLKPSLQISANFQAIPSASLPILTGQHLLLSSPSFDGLACYNPIHGKTYGKLTVDFEVLEIMGIRKKDLDAVMQGGLIGGIIGGVVIASMATGPFGLVVGAVAAIASAIMWLVNYAERKRQEIRIHNTKIANQVCIPHICIVQSATELLKSRIVSLPNDTVDELISVLETFSLNEELDRLSSLSYKIGFQDCSVVYEKYLRLLQQILTIKERSGLLNYHELDLSEYNVHKQIIHEYNAVDPFPDALLKTMPVFNEIVKLCCIPVSQGFTSSQDNSGFSCLLPNVNVKVCGSREFQKFHISPVIPTVYETHFKSQVTDSSFSMEELISQDVKGVTAKARIFMKGIHGLQFLQPVITKVIETKGTNIVKFASPEQELIISPAKFAGRQGTSIYLDSGELYTVPYMITSDSEFHLERTENAGIILDSDELLPFEDVRPEETQFALCFYNHFLKGEVPPLSLLQCVNALFDPYVSYTYYYDLESKTMKLGVLLETNRGLKTKYYLHYARTANFKAYMNMCQYPKFKNLLMKLFKRPEQYLLDVINAFAEELPMFDLNSSDKQGNILYFGQIGIEVNDNLIRRDFDVRNTDLDENECNFGLLFKHVKNNVILGLSKYTQIYGGSLECKIYSKII